MIIGITGKAGSGKNLCSEIIEKQLKSVESLAFAEPLKEAAKILFNFNDNQLHNLKEKEEIDTRWDKSPRQIFQWLGGLLRKDIDKNFFIEHMKQRIENSYAHFIVVTDVRFLNELELIKSMGGKVIKIVRPNAKTTEYSDDVSEKGIDDELVDVLIINDGTVEDLSDKIKEILNLHT